MDEGPCSCTKLRARVCSGIACVGSDREVVVCAQAKTSAPGHTEGTGAVIETSTNNQDSETITTSNTSPQSTTIAPTIIKQTGN